MRASKPRYPCRFMEVKGNDPTFRRFLEPNTKRSVSFRRDWGGCPGHDRSSLAKMNTQSMRQARKRWPLASDTETTDGGFGAVAARPVFSVVSVCAAQWRSVEMAEGHRRWLKLYRFFGSRFGERILTRKTRKRWPSASGAKTRTRKGGFAVGVSRVFSCRRRRPAFRVFRGQTMTPIPPAGCLRHRR